MAQRYLQRKPLCRCVFNLKKKITAYPSLMNLGSWTQDLIKRINHFTVWADRVHPPVLFWLGAYTYPTSFLTAVLQATICTIRFIEVLDFNTLLKTDLGSFT